MNRKGKSYSSLNKTDGTLVRRSARLLTHKSIKNSNTLSGLLNHDVLRHILILLAQDLARNEADWKWFTLSHVCRQWRTVALDTGAFWSNIVWDSTSVDMIKVQLSRSKNSKLSITFIRRKPKFKLGATRSLEDLLDAIKQHKERISHIHIQVFDYLSVDFKDFLKRLPSKLHKLYIRLYTDSRPSGHAREELDPEFISSPTGLRILHIQGFKLPQPWLKISPFIHLIDLTFCRVQFEDLQLRDIVRIFPNLESLSILYCSSLIRGMERPGNSSSLASLRNLKIYNGNTSVLYWLFDNLNPSTEANCDIRCTSVIPLSTLTSRHSPFWVHTKIADILFNRNPHREKLYLFITDNSMLFRSSCMASEASFSFLYENSEESERSQPKERFCSTLHQIITKTYCRMAENVHVHLNVTSGTIAKDMWAELLSYFGNILRLEVTLICEDCSVQAEFAKNLRFHAKQRNNEPYLTDLSLNLSRFNAAFLKELKRTLFYMKNNTRELRELNISYPTEINHTLIGDISKCVQQLNVKVDPSLATKRARNEAFAR